MEFLTQAIFTKCKSISTRLHLGSRLTDFANIFKNRRGYMVIPGDWSYSPSCGTNQIFYVRHVYEDDGCPIIGVQGYQFYKTVKAAYEGRDVENGVDIKNETNPCRFIEVEAIGDVEEFIYSMSIKWKAANQMATNKIRVIRELGFQEVYDLMCPDSFRKKNWESWMNNLYEYDLHNLR